MDVREEERRRRRRPFEGKYFVGPHAVRQFQRRIAPRLSYEEARRAILEGLENTASTPRPAQCGVGYYLRVRRPYSFRALIGPGKGELPAVITILRSGSGRGGKRHRTKGVRPSRTNGHEEV